MKIPTKLLYRHQVKNLKPEQNGLMEDDWYGGETPEEDEMTGLAINDHNRLEQDERMKVCQITHCAQNPKTP